MSPRVLNVHIKRSIIGPGSNTNQFASKPSGLKRTSNMTKDTVDVARPSAWIVEAACHRCLQVHLAPLDSNSNTRRWWCSQRPATPRERTLFYRKLHDDEMNASTGIPTQAQYKIMRDSTATKKKRDEAGRRRHSNMVRVRDDPVGDGIKIALDKSAKLELSCTDAAATTVAAPLHFATGETYIDIDTMLTLDDIRHDEPGYFIKTVAPRRRRGKKSKKTAMRQDGAVGGDGVDDEFNEYDFVDGTEDDNDDDVLSVAEWDDLD